jgi:hypothetical protein
MLFELMESGWGCGAVSAEWMGKAVKKKHPEPAGFR